MCMSYDGLVFGLSVTVLNVGIFLVMNTNVMYVSKHFGSCFILLIFLHAWKDSLTPLIHVSNS